MASKTGWMCEGGRCVSDHLGSGFGSRDLGAAATICHCSSQTATPPFVAIPFPNLGLQVSGLWGLCPGNLVVPRCWAGSMLVGSGPADLWFFTTPFSAISSSSGRFFHSKRAHKRHHCHGLLLVLPLTATHLRPNHWTATLTL